MKESVGPRSEALLKEVKSLEASRNETMERERDLAQKVADRQETLDKARAQGLLGVVDKDQVRAFEAEVDTLQNQFVQLRSTLAGLGHLLDQKREALEQAKEADIQEAISTRAMAKALAGLRKNERALEKNLKALQEAYEVGATRLLEETAPHREKQAELFAEREALYVQRHKALGKLATMRDMAYNKMVKDPFARRPFGDVNDIPQTMELAKILQPLNGKMR